MRWIEVVAVVVCVSGCAGKPAEAPTRPLPAYSGHATELFDDTIDPAAVGLDVDRSYVPRSDLLLRERAQVADAVIRVKVATLTAKQEDSGTSYDIGFRSVETIAGDHPPSPDFGVKIGRASHSAGIMRSFEDRLVNKDFIVFVRLFVRSDGDKELHFHLAPDTKEMRVAVMNAVQLDRLK